MKKDMLVIRLRPRLLLDGFSRPGGAEIQREEELKSCLLDWLDRERNRADHRTLLRLERAAEDPL